MGVGEGLHGGVDKRIIGHAEQHAGGVVGEAVRAGAGEELVEHRERIAWGTTAGADDQGVDGVVNVGVLGGCGALNEAAHGLRGEQPEGIVVGARTDRANHFFRLGGGENEDQVCRWLFDDLEQSISTGVGDHVGFVDDEDAVARLGGGVHGAVAKLAHILHTVITGRVELSNVQGARAVRGQRHTRRALTARSSGRPLGAVQRTREDARRGSFAAATRPRKEVGVVDIATIQGTRKRDGYLFLPHNLRERAGAILPIQSHGLNTTYPPPICSQRGESITRTAPIAAAQRCQSSRSTPCSLKACCKAGTP